MLLLSYNLSNKLRDKSFYFIQDLRLNKVNF